MRRVHAPLALAATCVLAGCGGSPGDLMAVDVTGGPAGIARRSLVVTVDGRASCERRPMREITSAELLDARAIVRDAMPIAVGTQSYRPGALEGRRYTLHTQDGTVSWNETSPQLPAVLARAELFALKLGRRLC